MRVNAVSALIATAVAAILVTGVAARTQGAGDKSIFVSAIDGSGKPVTGMTADQFAVQEDNSIREIVGVKPATQPIFVTLLGDTTKAAGNQGMMSRADQASGGTELIRDIRSSFMEFAKQITTTNPGSEISVMEFGQAAIPVSNFSANLADIEKGIGRLFPKPDAASVLLEALLEANKLIGRKDGRKAIVVINIEPGDEQSRQEPNKIIQAFGDSRASLWAVSLQKGELRNPSRDLVLNRLTQITGGRREFVMGPSALQTLLKDYAATIAAQYELTYRRPASDKPTQIVRVGTTRQGVKLLAPAYPPK